METLISSLHQEFWSYETPPTFINNLVLCKTSKNGIKSAKKGRRRNMELQQEARKAQSKFFCGIDFHKNTCTYCVLDAQGNEIEKPTTIKTDKVVSFFSNRKDYHIGIEATGGANHIVQRLKECGHKVTLIDTVKFKAIGIGGKKTDEKDARAIADILRLNYLPEVYHKTLRARRIKSLLVHRELLVHSRVNMTNHIRGLLREYGITMPAGADQFWKFIGARLTELEDPILRDDLSWLVQSAKELNERIKFIDGQVEELGKNDEKYKRLQSVPGIGPITALLLIAIVDDQARFSDAKRFGSYLGLTPKEFSSGDKRRLGAITRSGPEMLRRYLIHGARAALMCTQDNTTDINRKWALRLKGRVGMNKATVGLAHRNARIAFAILRDGTTYLQRKSELVA